jgi:hypothetical protein
MLPENGPVILLGHEVDEDVLAGGVVCPVDLSPRHVYFARPALSESVLPEEQHEARPVLIHRPPVLLYETGAFDDINELDLLVAGEMWQRNHRQLLSNRFRGILGK